MHSSLLQVASTPTTQQVDPFPFLCLRKGSVRHHRDHAHIQNSTGTMSGVALSCTCPHLAVGKSTHKLPAASPLALAVAAATTPTSASTNNTTPSFLVESRSQKRRAVDKMVSVRTQALANYRRFLEEEDKREQAAAAGLGGSTGGGSLRAATPATVRFTR